MIDHYDPSAPAEWNGNFGGLPFDNDSAKAILIPVPWEVTVSSFPGTAGGPENIRQASYQLDFYDLNFPDGWKKGISMIDEPEEWILENIYFRKLARQHIDHLERGNSLESSEEKNRLNRINQACQKLNEGVKKLCLSFLEKGKLVGLIGGDHSTPLGYLQALSTRHEDFGILQIDAHCDLRNAYEGFTYSHASIMYNALDLPQISKLVQVGIRDFCDEEVQVIQSQPDRIHTFFDAPLQRKKLMGTPFHEICQEIISLLPQQVYISLDVDGLTPANCPNTGTPVPGGMTYAEAIFLLEQILEQGKTIIGFDLCETAGQGKLDAIVSSRLVLKLCYLMLN